MITKWKDEEREIVRLNYGTIGSSGCAKLMPGQSRDLIVSLACTLKVQKPLPPQGRERFESKFRVTPGCWIWLKGLNKGYGQYWDGKKNRRANRFSYELYVGPVPDHLSVCHRCDNPICVNPDHLWLGTNDANTLDRVLKGRNARVLGSAQSTAKLTDEQALEIRRASGMHKEIAARYGISTSNVSYIKSLKTWAHLKDEETES